MPNPAAAENATFLQLLAHLHRGGRYSYWWTMENTQSEWWPVEEPAPVPNGQSNHYFGIHPVAAIPENAPYRRSRIVDIVAVNCLYAEFDGKDFSKGDKEAAYRHLTGLEPPASVIIDSGGGYHAYWLLEQPYLIRNERERERIRHLQRHWTEYVRGDPGAGDLARMLRIPGTLNTKYEPSRPVRIVTAELERTYSVGVLERLLPAEALQPKRPSQPQQTQLNPEDRIPTERILDMALARAKSAGRNETGLWLACQLRDNGYDKSRALDVMLAYQSAVDQDGDHPYREREALASLEQAYASDARAPWEQKRPPSEEDEPVVIYMTADSGDLVMAPATLENALSQIGKLPDRVATEQWAWDNARACSKLPPSTWGHLAYALRQQGMTVRDVTDWKSSLRHQSKEEAETANVVLYSSDDYVKALRKLGYRFRMNACNDKVEINGGFISDAIRAKIRSQMRDKGFKNANEFEDAYTAHAYDNRFNPIAEYLKGLRWDGEDHISRLAAHFQDEHEPIRYEDGSERTVFHAWLRRWLAGSVSRVMDLEQNMMFVLDGAQNKGKSFFVRWLASPQADYFIEGPIKPESNDHLIRLMSHWVWEVAEFGSTASKANAEALKHFITMRIVTARAPYGRDDLIKPALSSFIGTINNATGFLVDGTGNRRFMVCTLQDIDWNYTQLDVSQVWAQATALWQEGETGHLTPVERRYQDGMNHNYEVEAAAESWLAELVEVDGASEEFVPTNELVKAISQAGWAGSTVQLTREIGKALTRLGARQVVKRIQVGGERKQRRGYVGLKRVYDPATWEVDSV